MWFFTVTLKNGNIQTPASRKIKYNYNTRSYNTNHAPASYQLRMRCYRYAYCLCIFWLQNQWLHAVYDVNTGFHPLQWLNYLQHARVAIKFIEVYIANTVAKYVIFYLGNTQNR